MPPCASARRTAVRSSAAGQIVTGSRPSPTGNSARAAAAPKAVIPGTVTALRSGSCLAQRPEEVDVGRVEERVPEGEKAGVLARGEDRGDAGGRLIPLRGELLAVRRHREEELLDLGLRADEGAGDRQGDALGGSPRLRDEEVPAAADEPRALEGDQLRVARDRSRCRRACPISCEQLLLDDEDDRPRRDRNLGQLVGAAPRGPSRRGG